MKSFELVKREDHWALYNEDGHKIASTIPGCNSKLSIKNCESIANGFDPEELAEKEFPLLELTNHSSDSYVEEENLQLLGHRKTYIKGFQKALSILGDKKFSVKDMEKLMFATIEFTEQKEGETYPFLKSFIQSLQQTELGIEIVTKPYTEVGEEFELELKREPKLDKDGCLILKRL